MVVVESAEELRVLQRSTAWIVVGPRGPPRWPLAVAVGQHVHRCSEGDPDPNQCIGRAKWDVIGKLWGQSWLGLAF